MTRVSPKSLMQSPTNYSEISIHWFQFLLEWNVSKSNTCSNHSGPIDYRGIAFGYQNIRYFLKHFSQTAFACFSQTALHDPQTLTRFSFLGWGSFGQDGCSFEDRPLCNFPIAPAGTCDKVTVVTAGDCPARLIGMWVGKFWGIFVASDRPVSSPPGAVRLTGGPGFRYLKSGEFLFKWWNWITDWSMFRFSFWRNCSFIAIIRAPQEGFYRSI